MKKYYEDVRKSAKAVLETEAAQECGKVVKETAIEAVKSDMFKQVAGGAAAGALMGSLVPIVGTSMGAAVGSIMGAYKAITK